MVGSVPSRRTFQAARAAVGVVTAIGIVSGCLGAAATSAPPSPDPIAASGSNGSVRITLTLEGPPRNDATSWVRVVIENVAARGVRWAGGGCGDPGETIVDASGAFPTGRTDWPGRLGAFKRLALGSDDPRSIRPLTVRYVDESRFGNDSLACPGDLRIETLAVGASLRYRAGWNEKLNGIAAPTGSVAVTAAFPFIGLDAAVPPDRVDSTDVTATVRTSILGASGAGGLPLAVAVDAALSDP
jgi:hypothetical protein